MRLNFQTSIEYRIFFSTPRKIEGSVAKIQYTRDGEGPDL